MRIGIDGSCWWNRRGFGRFTRELLQAMFAAPRGHQFTLFVDQAPVPEMACAGVRVVRVGTARTVTESAVASGNRSVRDVLAFRRAAAAEPLDVMFYPAVYSWFPARRRVPSVVTLHDAIAEHYPELIFPDRRGRLLWSLKVRLACWQASRILTVSQAAKAEIVEHMGLAPGRLEVICEGAHARFRRIAEPAPRAAARGRAGLPGDGRLIVYVGGFAPHKNLGNLLRAFAQAVEGDGAGDLRLALIGDPGGDGFHSNYGELVEQARADPRLSGRVHFTGFVSDDDLVALYSDALALALPSLSEGFGLPAIEALSCGTPVLASDRGAVPEVVGDAGLLFDPGDPEAIAAAIRGIATDSGAAEALRAKALARARRFTWRRAAELTFVVLETCGTRT